MSGNQWNKTGPSLFTASAPRTPNFSSNSYTLADTSEGRATIIPTLSSDNQTHNNNIIVLDYKRKKNTPFLTLCYMF